MTNVENGYWPVRVGNDKIMHCSKKGIACLTVHDEVSDKTDALQSPFLLASKVLLTLFLVVAWIKMQGYIVL